MEHITLAVAWKFTSYSRILRSHYSLKTYGSPSPNIFWMATSSGRLAQWKLSDRRHELVQRCSILSPDVFMASTGNYLLVRNVNVANPTLYSASPTGSEYNTWTKSLRLLHLPSTPLHLEQISAYWNPSLTPRSIDVRSQIILSLAQAAIIRCGWVLLDGIAEKALQWLCYHMYIKSDTQALRHQWIITPLLGWFLLPA
jgi:hypothetical protein